MKTSKEYFISLSKSIIPVFILIILSTIKFNGCDLHIYNDLEFRFNDPHGETLYITPGESKHVIIKVIRAEGNTNNIKLALYETPTISGISATIDPDTLVYPETLSTLTLSVSENVMPDTLNFKISGECRDPQDDAFHVTSFNLIIQGSVPDFSLSLSRSLISLEQGSLDTLTVFVNRSGGHSADINLSLDNVPPGVTYSFLPELITGNQNSSQLTITTDQSGAPGNYSLIVKGNDGALERSAGLQLIVGTPANPWQVQTSGVSKNLVGVHFTDTNNGYAVGNIGTILKTTNGGAVWNLLTPPPATHFTSVQFMDAMNGYVVGTGGAIYFTQDSGGSWIDKSIANITTDHHNLYFLSQPKGWVVGHYIHYTINGGNSWDLQLDYDPPREWYGVAFGNTDNGVVVGDKSGFGEIYYTTNGGLNWLQSNYPAGISRLNTVCFAKTNTAYAVGRNGTLLKSTDSGQNWVQINNSMSGTLWGVSFADEQNGWIVGDKIWRTYNGGQTWIEEEDPSNTIYRTYFLNSETGFVVGSSGLIMRRD